MRAWLAWPMVVLLVLGAVLFAYARWTRPLSAAMADVDAGALDAAEEQLRIAEARFDRMAPLKEIVPIEYDSIIHHELWLLYRHGQYDAVIEKADASRPTGTTHFWAGCALFQKARAEEQQGPRLGWLTRSEEEFRRALELQSDDWDTKYDYELTRRLVLLLQHQGTMTQTPKLLRPEPPPPDAQHKPQRVG